MIINQKKCVACGNCVAVCPMGAIYVDANRNTADIVVDKCVECGICFRGMSKENLNPSIVRIIRKMGELLRFRFEPEPDICPTSAIEIEDLQMPRLIRQIFSDPVIVHKTTSVRGRGTEEVKTNDVSSRIAIGEVGFTIELGRPGIGVRFFEIQEMTKALAKKGISFEVNNPITHLMTDIKTGELQSDILDQKVLSAIVEIKTNINLVEEILDIVNIVNRQINTVTVVGISTRCDKEGNDFTLRPLLNKLNYETYRTKMNLGIGRITNKIEDN